MLIVKLTVLVMGMWLIGYLMGKYERRYSMIDVTYEISKEDYEKALRDGAGSLIKNPALWMGYGVYDPRVYESDGKYYLTYSRGTSCD